MGSLNNVLLSKSGCGGTGQPMRAWVGSVLGVALGEREPDAAWANP